MNNCYLRNAHDAHGPGTRGMFLWHSSLRDENHDVEPHPIEPLVKHVHGWGQAMDEDGEQVPTLGLPVTEDDVLMPMRYEGLAARV